MRKLLLGSTAVAAAALFAPVGASAQTLSGDAFSSTLGAPLTSMRGALEVRLGGFYKAMYNRTDQDGDNSADVRLGKSDFSNEIEIHVLASGKAANGLRYGVALEIENDNVRVPGTIGKNGLQYDEAWAYLQGTFGQIRFGDEDGAIAQLQSGHITGFGLGGLDSGDLNQQVVGANQRAQFNHVNDLGDNTKLIYLSPQFFGLDAGISFAFNNQEGPLSGCDSLAAGAGSTCDRLSAIVGGSNRRRNEVQAALRWRGSFGPVGLAATVGYIGADAVKNIGGGSERLDMIWAGTALTGFGLTVGGWYTGGNGNAGFSTLQRRSATVVDDRRVDSFLVGATYTIDAFTVGGHFARTFSAGSQTVAAGRRDTGWTVGGNYRIAPGLDLFAEYNQVERRERGFNFSIGGNPVPNSADITVVLAGFRVAF
jgi:hypothetical protein